MKGFLSKIPQGHQITRIKKSKNNQKHLGNILFDGLKIEMKCV